MNSAKINTNNQHTVIKIAYNRKITIFDVEFNGIEEIKEYALKGVAKDGVYVAEDSQSYPCFDSSDFAYENRSFWNFIFARNREELERNRKRTRFTWHQFLPWLCTVEGRRLDLNQDLLVLAD